MTDPTTAERLQALQKSRQASSAEREPASGRPKSRAASKQGSGTKWTLAGAAVGATFTLMGAMAAGQGMTTVSDAVPQPVPAAAPAPQIIVVVSQPAATSTANNPQLVDVVGMTDLTRAVNEAASELPEPVPQQEAVKSAKRTESGGS